MKILFTGFYGFDNPSHIIVDKIDTDKIILKNSFEEINKKLALVNIEDYDLIIILGLRDKLKKRLKIEVNSMLACEELSTKLDYKKLAKHFKENNVPCIINDKKKTELNYHSYQNKKLQINESISSVRLHELMAGTNTPLDFIGNKISYTVNSKQNNDLSNYAYHKILQRNANSILINLPKFINIDELNRLIKIISNIDYQAIHLEKQTYKSLKKYIIREKLENMIGKIVNVYIDRPIGSNHPNYPEIKYPINYGYIKELTAVDGEYQDVYVLGEDKVIDQCKGIVYAVIERENDNEDKLVVVTDNKNYSIKEIKEKINFQEKYFKYKIVK